MSDYIYPTFIEKYDPTKTNRELLEYYDALKSKYLLINDVRLQTMIQEQLLDGIINATYSIYNIIFKHQCSLVDYPEIAFCQNFEDAYIGQANLYSEMYSKTVQ